MAQLLNLFFTYLWKRQDKATECSFINTVKKSRWHYGFRLGLYTGQDELFCRDLFSFLGLTWCSPLVAGGQHQLGIIFLPTTWEKDLGINMFWPASVPRQTCHRDSMSEIVSWAFSLPNQPGVSPDKSWPRSNATLPCAGKGYRRRNGCVSALKAKCFSMFLVVFFLNLDPRLPRSRGHVEKCVFKVLLLWFCIVSLRLRIGLLGVDLVRQF